jgi:DNA adenine methylase
MDYVTVAQFAKKHNISTRLVLRWIAEGRLAGAIQPARDWLIPANAKRPIAAAPYELKKKAAN